MGENGTTDGSDAFSRPANISGLIMSISNITGKQIIGITVICLVIYLWYHYCKQHVKQPPRIHHHSSELVATWWSGSSINTTRGRIKWHRRQSNTLPNQAVSRIILVNGWVRDPNNWDVYLPQDYNNDRVEWSHVPSSSTGRILLLVSGTNRLVAKQELWDYLQIHYGPGTAGSLAIPTFNLLDPKQVSQLIKQFKNESNQQYIIKKNVQRQTGIKIIEKNNPEQIKSAIGQGFVVAQPLITDTYLINNRKIGIRIYLCVICYNGSLEGWVHPEGIIHFAQDDYSNSTTESHITTGYVSPSFYTDNHYPQTVSELRRYLDRSNRLLSWSEKQRRKQGLLSNQLFNSIEQLIGKIMIPYKDQLGKDKRYLHHLCVQMYGVDIGVRSDLTPYLVEINKGPDFNFKGEKEAAVKYSVMEDMFRLIGLLDNGIISFKRVV